jgi:hypothetical protein
MMDFNILCFFKNLQKAIAKKAGKNIIHASERISKDRTNNKRLIMLFLRNFCGLISSGAK